MHDQDSAKGQKEHMQIRSHVCSLRVRGLGSPSSGVTYIAPSPVIYRTVAAGGLAQTLAV